jgi:hypothetical protein
VSGRYFKFNRRCVSRRTVVYLLGAVLAASAITLQGQQVAEDPIFEQLPTGRQLAAALADPDSRQETLLTLIATNRLLANGEMAHPPDVDELVRRFDEDRAWLERLVGFYLQVPMSGYQMDPAAWFVMLELDQHQMAAGVLAGPTGPGYESLMRRLFDRENVQLAAAVLPEALQRMEYRAVPLWRAIRRAALSNVALAAMLARLNDQWFDPWSAAEPPAPDGQDTAEELMRKAADSLSALADESIMPGPPDALRLKRLRFSLLSSQADLDAGRLLDASYLLALASAIDALNQSRYLVFAETLLWVVSDLLLAEGAVIPDSPVATAPTENEPPAEYAAEQESEAGGVREDGAPGNALEQTDALPRASVVPPLLYALLPRLSSAYATDFSDVDPRINGILANAYDTVQYLQSGQPDQARLTALRTAIADSVAQLVLLLPEMSYYYDQPVRWPISEEIDICLGMMASRAPDGSPALSQDQFDGCMDRFASITEQRVNREDLAGDMDGPFGSEQLRRELMVPSWQRINYALGYLHERHETDCEPPETPLPNPVEWAGMANLVAWFASQSPAYLRNPANRAHIERFRQQGMDLLRVMSQQVDCVSAAGAGISDPVVRSLADYQSALDDLIGGVREAELAFRTARLQPGADVVLHGDAEQQTAYRSEGLTIGPCDPGRVCEMDGELEASRALIGQFPEPYLISDQTGMGEIEICYDNVRWVERRSEAVRPDDPFVANYFGRLSFDIIGRHREEGEMTPVFGFTFLTPEEYHYLFAAATEEVAEDPCPTEWVGSRIVTPLNNSGTVRVVPDRLTYLAGSRSQPSAILGSNWARGEKWRDWLISGVSVVTPHEYPADAGIVDRVNRHLQALYQAKQALLYSALLQPPRRSGWGASNDLFDLQIELSVRKSLVRSYLTLFYPQSVTNSEEIRRALEGRSALLDTARLRQFREGKVAVSSFNDEGRSRLDRFQAHWDRQPDALRRSGSISTSVAHALIRLNDVYSRYLTEKKIIRPAGLRG